MFFACTGKIMHTLSVGFNPDEVALDMNFVWSVWLPLKIVWMRTRRELVHEHWMKMTNEELLELVIDTERLTKYGYGGYARYIHRVIDIHGYQNVVSFLSKYVLLA